MGKDDTPKEPTATNGPPSEEPQYVTAEQVKAITNETAHAASTSQIKRLEKALPEIIRKTVQEALALRLAEGGEKQVELPLEGGKDSLALLRKEFEAKDQARQRAFDQLKAEQADKERVLRENALESAAAAKLSEAGVLPSSIEMIVALWRKKGTLILNDQGEPILKLQRDGYVDEVALDEGIKSWRATEAAQAHLVPRGVSGSGANVNGAPPKNGHAPTKEELKTAAMATLLSSITSR